MTVGDQAQEAGIGTYCWNDNPAGGQGIGLCVDMIGIMTPLEPLVLPAGEFTAQFHLPLETAPTTAVLEVMPSTGQSTPIEGQNIQAWQPQPGERLDVPLEVEPSVALNLEPGLHILALFAQWEGIGDVMYGFLVQVGESGGGPAFTLPASCLPGDQSLAPYVDPGGRYCLLFPNHFRIGDVTLDRTNFYGPPLDQSLEPLFASLALQVEGAANGRDLSQVVDEFVQANAQGLPVTRRPITLGGEPAEVVEGVPGRLLSWQVFVIHADTVYHLSLFPMDPGVPQVEPDTQAVWQAVSTSLTFMGQ
jgi:hypothetical protein